MFPLPEHPSSPAHGWLSTLRHGLDLIVAFATLRDVDPSPEAGWRDADDPFDCASFMRPVVAVPPATAAAKHLRTSGYARPDLAHAGGERTRTARADHAGPAAPARADHAARRPRPCRAPPAPPPGHRAVADAPPGRRRPEPQPCLTPLVARRSRPTAAPARGARH